MHRSLCRESLVKSNHSLYSSCLSHVHLVTAVWQWSKLHYLGGKPCTLHTLSKHTWRKKTSLIRVCTEETKQSYKLLSTPAGVFLQAVNMQSTCVQTGIEVLKNSDEHFNPHCAWCLFWKENALLIQKKPLQPDCTLDPSSRLPVGILRHLETQNLLPPYLIVAMTWIVNSQWMPSGTWYPWCFHHSYPDW